MEMWHLRARRYPFVANIELTDMQTETRIVERTIDLSLYGCRVQTQKPLSIGTKVRIRISHAAASFAALGRVAYVGPNGAMGLTFTDIDENNQSVLDEWVFEERRT